MRDQYSSFAAVEAIAPAVPTADTASGPIDLRDFGAATIVLSVGVGGITFTAANKIEFVLTHSDDDASYNPVGDADVLGVTNVTGGIIKALTAAKPASSVDRVGYIGGKRFLKLQADFSGTHGTGTGVSAVVVKGLPSILPVA